MFQRSSLRYAHARGNTVVTYVEDGECIITGGADGDIRKWRGIDDDDPSSHPLGECVFSLAAWNDVLFASTDLNSVQTYTCPTMEQQAVLMQFTSPVTCIAINKDYIAAGSRGAMLKVSKREVSKQSVELKGHTGPVLAMDISCTDMLASIAGDGTLKLWSLKEMKLIKTITGLVEGITFEDFQCLGSPSFEPLHGTTLIYAAKRKLIVLDCATWNVHFTLSDEEVRGNFSCCRFSPDGLLIAAGTDRGEISVFDFPLRQRLKSDGNSNAEGYGITAIAWHPSKAKQLAFCDNMGQLGVLSCGEGEKIVQDEYDHQTSDSNDSCVTLEKFHNVEEEQIQPEMMDDGQAVHHRPSLFSSVIKMGKQQAPFQPSSTPAHLGHRYLVWNDVGVVTAHQEENGEGSIDVEFHDTTIHHALHIRNSNNYTMASLSSTVLVLSSDGASKVVGIMLSESNKEWILPIQGDEGVVAVVATSKLVAVATDMNFLRILSARGTQREVITIPGPLLSMAGFNDRLFVCFHSDLACQYQWLSALLLQSIGMSLLSRWIRLPLAAGRKITWLGYSDRGSPAFCDSMGLVQLYSMKTRLWYPVSDTAALSPNVSDNHFVIGVLEKEQKVQAVLCCGSHYPAIQPRPLTTELPMQLLLCDEDSERTEHEDSLVRSCTFDINDADNTIREKTIKLFMMACSSDQESRAKELIEMIASPDLLSLAIKCATKMGREHLSVELREMMPQLKRQSNEREKEALDMESGVLAIIENNPLNSGLLLMRTTNNMATATVKGTTPTSTILTTRKRLSMKHSSTINAESNKNVKAFQAYDGDECSQIQQSIGTTELSPNEINELPSIHSPTPANPFVKKRKLDENSSTSTLFGRR